MIKGVHQTAKTAKTAPKPLIKWHNRITLHRTASNSAPHRMVQCGLRFYNKKTTQTAPSLYINIYIYIYFFFFLFNIKYIINSLITLVFFKKKKKVDNPSKC